MQELSGLTPILFFTFLGSIVSLLGGVILLTRTRLAESISHVLVSFAAGALLGTAFFELLPEAQEHAEELALDTNIFFWVLLGILGFYFLDRSIHWFYHHRSNKSHDVHQRPIVPLIMVGDSLHNFIDGVAIAITFLVNPSLGVLTAIAVIAHELPQEIGDFAVLLHAGLSRKKVLLFNIASAFLALLGATLAYMIGEQIEMIVPYALAITAGLFLYIALTNLIPEIHHEEKKGYAIRETIFFVLGIAAIWIAVTYLSYGH